MDFNPQENPQGCEEARDQPPQDIRPLWPDSWYPIWPHTPYSKWDELDKKPGKDSSTVYSRLHHSTKCDGWPRRLSEHEWKALINNVNTPFTDEELEQILIEEGEPLPRNEIRDPNKKKDVLITSFIDDCYPNPTDLYEPPRTRQDFVSHDVVAPIAVYHDLLCEECLADIHELPIKPHRSSKRITVWTESKLGSRTKIAYPEIDLPHLERDYHNDLICNRCGLIRSDPFDTVYIPKENHQLPDNADMSDEDDTDITRYGMPYTGTKYYDKVFAAAYGKNPSAIISDPENKLLWEKQLSTNPRGKVNIHRSKDVVWQYCAKTKCSFLARELVRIDRATGQREFFCIICHKAGFGRRSWHYWARGRPLGYVQQGVLTAIQAVSKERAEIGLNPPSIADIQNYAGGWWPVSPYVGGTGHFVLEGFSYSNVRDIINLYQERGMICLIEDQLTHEKRILGGRSLMVR